MRCLILSCLEHERSHSFWMIANSSMFTRVFYRSQCLRGTMQKISLCQLFVGWHKECAHVRAAKSELPAKWGVRYMPIISLNCSTKVCSLGPALFRRASAPVTATS